MTVMYRGRRVCFASKIPANTVRRHETPALGDSQEAIKRASGGCLDFNMGIIVFKGRDGKPNPLPVAGHWSVIRQNGYTHTVIDGHLRPLTTREKNLTMQQWVSRHGGTIKALNALRKRGSSSRRAPINDYPMTWAQAVPYAQKHNTVLTPELKSRAFASHSVAEHMVRVCRAHDYPLWTMALLKMKDAQGKCLAIRRAGGQFALIFGTGSARKAARGTSKVSSWVMEPNEVWGPATAKAWLRRR